MTKCAFFIQFIAQIPMIHLNLEEENVNIIDFKRKTAIVMAIFIIALQIYTAGSSSPFLRHQNQTLEFRI